MLDSVRTLHSDVGDAVLLVNALEDASNDLVRSNLIAALKAFSQQSVHALLPLHRRCKLQVHAISVTA